MGQQETLRASSAWPDITIDMDGCQVDHWPRSGMFMFVNGGRAGILLCSSVPHGQPIGMSSVELAGNARLSCELCAECRELGVVALPGQDPLY